MAILRFKALDEISKREPFQHRSTHEKISSIFGIDVFDREKMRNYIPRDAFEAMCRAIDENAQLDRKTANQIAMGMKTWAIERGATHYSHWFQPLNDSTAEKHDSFFEPTFDGGSVETFRGELLIQQEPDASSFPTGGLRNTFEARGYSAWDPSSPAFLIGKTLCIPSIFIAYTGEALDFKTPLLKSLNAVEEAAAQVAQYFDKDVKEVNVTLGWEQEYFLVDEALFLARPDLAQTGRTLMGHIAAKDQQLEDHYFGAIPSRVSEFMKDFEEQAYRLGIPLKTRHNEVAPNQFECAPMFEEANIAVDHNTLLMNVMRSVARQHKLRVLFHEKPFYGVNGSGKHCNWSLMTDTGVNLLAPGKTPRTNTQFLTFFVCAIKAANDYGSLMMASIQSESNSHRLGAHEAPPGIMSVFAGSTLSNMLDSIEERITDKKMTPDEKTDIKLDIGKIPSILLDNTDRNRTSPFAFTGNRFEFRAAGASDNCAAPLIVINTAVAETLIEFKKQVDKLIDKGVKKDEAILQVIQKYIAASKRIRFEGNGYGEEWLEEAKRRGLENVQVATDAFKVFLRPENVALFKKHNIYREAELYARCEIKHEILVKKIQIESRVLADLATNHIVPTAIKYQNVLIQNVQGLKAILPDSYEELAAEEIRTIRTVAGHVKAIREGVHEMIEQRKIFNNEENLEKRAAGYLLTVRPYLDTIRYHIDHLERIVDDELWPLPKYREMMAIS
ncbi:MAG: glutamine synthetase III [Rikenellaceae bacterium]|jgi:glutamine synthetase|nr:glutamine synthetase III [Rikenellaceae bacterium]